MLVTLFRTVILYIVVILSLRIMGKRQIGDLQPGELVITILISELAAMPIQDTSQPVITGVLAIFTLVVMEILVSFLAMKCRPLHRLINGRSGVLIRDGKIDQRMMKTMRVTVSDLLEQLRGQNVFDISEVAYAILETNGQISVMLKKESRPLTVSDAGVQAAGGGFGALVVSDGVVIEEGLRLAGISRADVERAARRQGLTVRDIFLMTADSTGRFYTIKKEGAR